MSLEFQKKHFAFVSQLFIAGIVGVAVKFIGAGLAVAHGIIAVAFSVEFEDINIWLSKSTCK
jgi:hypothetical protein